MRKIFHQEIYTILGFPVEGSKQHLFQGVSVDSRNVEAGNLFFALKGEKYDGHRFLKEAVKRGASGAVVRYDYDNSIESIPFIRVEDPLKALQKLAAWKVQQSRSKIIAVTGSCGKTTTKDFIYTLLSKRYRCARSKGNYNSQIGLPLTLLNDISGDEEFLVLEMGMSKKGQIKNLCEIAPPYLALVTALDYAHTENFENLEDVAEAKAEIFTHHSSGIGIYPLEILHSDVFATTGACQKQTYSTESNKADYFFEHSNNNLSFTTHDGDKFPIPLSFTGGIFDKNLLAAMTTCYLLGLEPKDIVSGIPSLKLPEKRLEKLEIDGTIFINDCYNASPLSFRAALQELSGYRDSRKVVVFGEMQELGKFSNECHRKIGEDAVGIVDQMICYGKGCSPIVESFERAGRKVSLTTNWNELVLTVKSSRCKGDVVLLKGANKHKLWRLLEEF